MSKKSRRYNTVDFNFVPEDIVSYKTPTVLNTLCSADDILDRMRYDAAIHFKNLRNGEIKITDVYSSDDKCMCKMGWGKRPYVNKVFCNGCELIRRICSDVRIPEDFTINILTGKYTDRVIQVREIEAAKYGEYTHNPDYQAIFNYLTLREREAYLSGSSSSEKNFKTKIMVTDSPVTNYITTCVFMNNKLQKYKIPNICLFDWTFSCDDKVRLLEPPSLSLDEVCMIENYQKKNKTATANVQLNPLTVAMTISILKQLVSTLHFMNKYFFIHGRPCLDYIRFTKKAVSYKYLNVSIECPVTLHIQPTFSSSFTYDTDDGRVLRLVAKRSHNVNKNVSLPIEFTDIIVTPKAKAAEVSNDIGLLQQIQENMVYGYKIGNRVSNFIEYTTMYGVPLLDSSFEFYCFLTALLCEDSFYITFMQNDSLRSVWYNLWRIGEYDDVMKELVKLKLLEKVEYENIIKYVSKFTLRTDAIDYFWENISTIV